jgi:KDO2-lipid IV(A) lauroyltransferase
VASPPSLPARALALGVEALLCAVPPQALLATAELLGEAWYRLSRRRRAVVRENLRIAFGPPRDEAARGRLARRACGALGRVFAEAAIGQRLLGTPGQVRRRVRFLGDWDALRADAARGRGGLVVTGHLGSWELGAIALRHQGVRVHVVARPLDHPLLEAFVTRRRGGAAAVLPKVGGLRGVLARLAEGAWVALLADQNAGRHGLFVPFFGLAASTFPTAAVLAVRRGVPVYLGVCLRRPGAEPRFDVHLERLSPPPSGASASARVRGMLVGLNASLERWIRRAPEQYNWAHRRWKTRPPGGAHDPGAPSYARRRAPQPGRAVRVVGNG